MQWISKLLGLKVGAALVGVALATVLAGGCPPVTPPPPPLTGATASTSAAPTVDKTVSLYASASGGTSPLAYAWTLVDGPAVTIVDGTTTTASFVPTAAAKYTFRVTVTDSSTTPQTLTADVEVVVGDIQFFVPSGDLSMIVGSSSNPAKVLISGNPATAQVQSTVSPGERALVTTLYARVAVFDPEYEDDQRTRMTVTYDLVSVPSAAATTDASLDRSFDTISNQGTGDFDFNPSSSLQSLDGVVGVTIRANPDVTFSSLTNLASLITNYGTIVPGDYVLRATVTNPAGVQRTRDLTVTLLTEGVIGAYGGLSAGPSTIAVRTLPTGSPGNVTDKVMLGTQTTTMVVSVLPASTTSYRFFLREENAILGLGGAAGDIAHPEFVSASVTTPVAAGATATDITLTIGATAGMPTGTYVLWYEAFDSLGNIRSSEVMVNGYRSVRFHVTDDFYAATSINAARVGAASGLVGAPVPYEGWSGLNTTYGALNALADVNGDGALDIITATTTGFKVNTAGFVDGSTAALRHPDNSGNFDGALSTSFFSVSVGLTPEQLAAGDLNGDGWPDVAVSDVGTAVRVYFHTGNPAAPYSDEADQALFILPPETDRRAYDSSTQTYSAASLGPADTSEFGTQLGIFEQTGDTAADLVFTDPGFGRVQVLNVAAPVAPDIAPPAANDFYLGREGRVYVFAGGSTGGLQPGRPDIITSLITEREISDGLVTAFPTNPVLSTSFDEPAATVEYTRVYEGAELDRLGHALSNVGASFAVGSASAAGDGTKELSVQIVNPVVDGETLTIAVETPGPGGGFVARVYEFDTDGLVGPASTPVALGADLTGANALTQLEAVIDAEAVGDNLVTATSDTVQPERLILRYAYDGVDAAPRTITGLSTMASADNGVISAGVPVSFTVVFAAQNMDGAVYRVANALPTAQPLTSPIYGTQDSNMGFGAGLALGNFNDSAASAVADDLAIAALDPGTAAGVNDGSPLDGDDDGAVFVLLDGSTTFTAATLVTGVGATTLRSGGYGGTDLPPTGVGASVAFGDVNNDSLDELFFTEVGFDHIYLIKGAATPAATPDITFTGVVFNTTLAGDGTFLFGDITGDTQTDWIFLDGSVNLGFAGFDRTTTP